MCKRKRNLFASKRYAVWAQTTTVGHNEHVQAKRAQMHMQHGNLLTAMTKLFEAQAPFHIMICAATGGKRAMGPFLEMDLDEYQASFAKLWGYTNAVRLGTKHLTEDGNIVLVSGAAARVCKPGQVALSTVNSAVEQFARAVAPEISPRRINVVTPGLTETEMFGAASDERSSLLQAMTAKHLIPRPGTPDEVAQAILFVATNGFVTGSTVDVDGGWKFSSAV